MNEPKMEVDSYGTKRWKLNGILQQLNMQTDIKNGTLKESFVELMDRQLNWQMDINNGTLKEKNIPKTNGD